MVKNPPSSALRISESVSSASQSQTSETPLLPLRPETKGRIDEVKNLALFAFKSTSSASQSQKNTTPKQKTQKKKPTPAKYEHDPHQ